MTKGGQKAEVRGQKWRRLILVVALASVAATNSAIEDEDLKLLPPHTELPPTLWEQHGGLLICGAIIGVAALALVLWLLLRSKPSVAVPIEIQARHELEGLRQHTEDSQVLSRASRAVRRYFTTAFELSDGEMTTTEISRAMAMSEKFSPELTTNVSDYLRRCDELKFSPTPAPGKVGAAEKGLELVRLGEERRALLRQSAAQAANASKPSA